MHTITNDTKTSTPGPGMEMFATTRTTFLREAGGFTERRWWEFYEHYGQALLRYATQFRGESHDVAEIAVQDTMILLARVSRLIYRPPNKKFRYVLVAILNRKLGNVRRSAARERNRNDPRHFTELYRDQNDFEKDVRRRILEYLHEDLIGKLLAHGLEDEDVDKHDVELWYEYDPCRRNLRRMGRDLGVDKNTVKAAVERVNSYLEKECEDLFIPIARGV